MSATERIPEPHPTAPLSLLGSDRAALAAWMVQAGEAAFHARQVLAWVHQRGIVDCDRMTDLSRALRARLGDTAEVRRLPVLSRERDADGTEKWLFQVDAQNAVEAVVIPDEDRRTLCLSTQAGCVLHCAFCATGAQGFSRNLTSAEIVAQLWQVWHAGSVSAPQRPVHNVVFMGMGEPLANYAALSSVLHLLTDDCAYGFSKWRVTVSTAGLVPVIDRLASEHDVALAISLHAARDELRDRLVPINRVHPLTDLLGAMRRYADRHPDREILVEYVMLDGVNDTPADARALIRCLAGIPVKVNLIPFNPFPASGFARSPVAVIEDFQRRLIDSGIRTLIRRPRGESIAAACGQLAGRVANRLPERQRFALAGASA